MMHVMCGIPGSGKTTLSQELAIEDNAVLYCYDKMPNAHRKETARLAMLGRIARDLNAGKNIVCDDLHITKESRTTVLNIVSEISCKKILHVMNVPLDVCLERTKKRDKWVSTDHAVISCYNHYEEPTLDEGWDEIIYHEYMRE